MIQVRLLVGSHARSHARYLHRMTARPKPVYARRLFWDVDPDRLDVDLRAAFVIERVFERGDVEDIRQCRRYYGDEQVRKVLLNAKFLPEHRMHLASAVVGEPLEKFRCYTLRRSSPGLFPY